MVKRILIREEYCMGCRLCEVHCLVQHSKTKNMIKAYKGEYPKPIPRIIVEEEGHVSFALQCRHCEDAPCLEACITGALYRDRETGVVLCDEDKCVGCQTCVPICPGQAIFMVDESVAQGRAVVTVPYEFRPLPEEGEKVLALDRSGKELGEAIVTRVRKTEKMDQTALVSVEVPREWSMETRAFRLQR